MIATHHIKVNGRWVEAGQEYTAETEPAKQVSMDDLKEPEKAPTEKPKAPARRKVSK